MISFEGEVLEKIEEAFVNNFVVKPEYFHLSSNYCWFLSLHLRGCTRTGPTGDK